MELGDSGGGVGVLGTALGGVYKVRRSDRRGAEESWEGARAGRGEGGGARAEAALEWGGGGTTKGWECAAEA